MQMNLVDVVFRASPKSYTFDSQEFKIIKGDNVVVETVQGIELATAVTCTYKSDKKAEGEDAHKPILRLATKKDIEDYNQNKIREAEIKKRAVALVKEANIDMKIVSTELTLNASKLLINFTADNRVDFRDLVKDFATEFKSRIELKQIGARDETRIVGGFGTCGKPCCCKQFLTEFEHVTIKMAKVQGLSLNPTKINGLCGRLMCCLEYENSNYVEASHKMPKINSEVITPDGKGIVLYNNLLKEMVTVKLFVKDNAPPEHKEFKLSDIKFTKTRPNNDDISENIEDME